jgi:hypothetical protein
MEDGQRCLPILEHFPVQIGPGHVRRAMMLPSASLTGTGMCVANGEPSPAETTVANGFDLYKGERNLAIFQTVKFGYLHMRTRCYGRQG